MNRTRRPGEPVAKESLGTSVDPGRAKLSAVELKTGRWAVGPRQVVLDAGTAAREHYAIGDTVTVSTLGSEHRFTMTGTSTTCQRNAGSSGRCSRIA